MRVALLTEGTYPVVTGGVSTWCDQLVRGMPEHEFHITTLTGSGHEQVVWDLPPQVRSVTLEPVWGPTRSALPIGRARRRWVDTTRDALDRLWLAALGPDDANAVAETTSALQQLVGVSDHVDLARVLTSTGSVGSIMAAWATHHGADDDAAGEAADRPGIGARALTVADAVHAAAIVDRTLALVDRRLPDVDVVHASSNGPATLLGLAHTWRTGAPVMLTEHGVYLRERYLALHDANVSWPVRRVVTAFLRRLCQVGYAQSHLILPVNRFNGRWEQRLSADPGRVHTIPNGVDPGRFAPIKGEPPVPTISFIGRIDPLKDLATLLRAFAIVTDRLPEARLRLFGPTPASNASYKEGLVALSHDLGIAAAVQWEGPCDGSRPAAEAGHVVALSSISEGLPFTLIESMMCARPTVSTDVGGVSECLDANQETGLLVPARDPRAFAEACIDLLEDPDRRARMGAAANRRALELFTLAGCIARYRDAYLATADGTTATFQVGAKIA